MRLLRPIAFRGVTLAVRVIYDALWLVGTTTRRWRAMNVPIHYANDG